MTKDWFIVPVESVTDPPDGRRPKYAPSTFAGTVVDFSELPGPLSGDRYVAKFEATDTELNAVESNGDALRLSSGTDESQIAVVLSHVTGNDYTFGKLSAKFDT